MRVRDLRRAPRRMVVCRAGAWGEVVYVRKRAMGYSGGDFRASFRLHCPADPLGLLRTAQLAAAFEEAATALPVAAPAWATRNPEEVYEDIRQALRSLMNDPEPDDLSPVPCGCCGPL